MRRRILTISAAVVIIAAAVGIAAFAAGEETDSSSVSEATSTAVDVTNEASPETAEAVQAQTEEAATVQTEETAQPAQTAIQPLTDLAAPLDGYDDIDFNDISALVEDGFTGWYHMPAEKGENVYSVLDGTVERACYYYGFGLYIIVKHTDGTYSHYAHLNEINVEVGDSVEKGQIIGTVGISGATVRYGLVYSRSSMALSELDKDVNWTAYDPVEGGYYYSEYSSTQKNVGIIRDADGNIVEEI